MNVKDQRDRHKRSVLDRLRSRGMDDDLAADVKVLKHVESRLHQAEGALQRTPRRQP
jgi:hypothetical protein